MVKENLVPYFTARIYDSVEDLAEPITNPANRRSFTLNHSRKDNINFAHP
jgi:hypothetical protein